MPSSITIKRKIRGKHWTIPSYLLSNYDNARTHKGLLPLIGTILHWKESQNIGEIPILNVVVTHIINHGVNN